MPTPALAADDFDTTLNQLSELQSLAESYADKQGDDTDPIELMLAYTRMGAYNDTVWQLTAGSKDPDFETYVLDQNGDLADLMGMGNISLPNGQSIDFGHLLASINLVYRGCPSPAAGAATAWSWPSSSADRPPTWTATSP